MAHLLPWLTVALGLIAAALAVGRLPKRWSLPTGAKPFAMAAGGVLVLGVAATLPTDAPWSPGQSLLPGMALGGILTVLAVLLGRELPGEREGNRYLAAAARLGLLAAGAAILVSFNPHGVLDRLVGFMLAAITVGILLSAVRLAADDEDTRALTGAAEWSALAAVAVAAATWLATYHRSPLGIREWQALPSLFAGAMSLLLAIRGLLSPPEGRENLFNLLLLFLPLALVAWVIGNQLDGTTAFLSVAVAGMVLYGLVAWLGENTESGSDEGASGLPIRVDFGLLAGLLVIGGTVFAFRGPLHGYGIALLALAGLVVAATLPVGHEIERPFLRSAVWLAVLMALFRVYGEDATQVPDAGTYYHHVGFVIGALFPLFLGASLVRWTTPDGGEVQTRGLLLRVGLVGLLTLLMPLGLWLLIGWEPLTAVVSGLSISVAVLLALKGDEGSVARVMTRLSAAGIALAAAQFTPLIEPLALRTRQQRVMMLLAVGALIVLWVAVTAWLERRKPAEEPQRA